VRRGAITFLAVAGAACGNGGGGGTEIDAQPDGFDRLALLERVGAHVDANYAAFATESAELATAVTAWCAALGGTDADATRAAAQQAWRDAIDVWQRAEAILVGPPAAEMNTLRDRIYSWPLASTCAVDQDVVARWTDPDTFDVATRLNNRRSLAAVEYLLFAPSLAHTCPSQSAPPGWDAMADADRLAARCGLAAAVTEDVAAQAAVVDGGWDAYLATLTGAASLQDSLNVVSDAMFYVDTMAKDMKLGETSGVVANTCGTVQEPCLAEVEHRTADHGKPALLANLRSLQVVFTGTIDGEEGTGFDDFLTALGAEDLATRMTGELEGGIAAVEALDGTMLEALASDYTDVVAAHAAVKLFTDDLKSQFLTVLGLDIPDDVAADND
jgi:predicted lipoprotein